MGSTDSFCRDSNGNNSNQNILRQVFKNRAIKDVNNDNVTSNQSKETKKDEAVATDKGVSNEGNTYQPNPRTPNVTKCSRNVDEVKEWLITTVELPEYYDTFVQNGLDSLNLIRKMNDNGLMDLGIELKGHRIIIMQYIKQLNQ